MSSSSTKKRGRRTTSAANEESPSPSPPPARRKQVEIATDAQDVLVKCRALRDQLRAKAADKESGGEAVLSTIPKNIVEVDELPTEHVLEGIEGVALGIAHQVLYKQGFSMDIPSRAASNQVYVKEWDRIVLGDKRSSRSFLNVKVRYVCVCRIAVTSLCQRPSLTLSFLYIGVSQDRQLHFESCNSCMPSFRRNDSHYQT